jgi:hypothetical protein
MKVSTNELLDWCEKHGAPNRHITSIEILSNGEFASVAMRGFSTSEYTKDAPWVVGYNHSLAEWQVTSPIQNLPCA